MPHTSPPRSLLLRKLDRPDPHASSCPATHFHPLPPLTQYLWTSALPSAVKNTSILMSRYGKIQAGIKNELSFPFEKRNNVLVLRPLLLQCVRRPELTCRSTATRGKPRNSNKELANCPPVSEATLIIQHPLPAHGARAQQRPTGSLASVNQELNKLKMSDCK